MSTILPKLTPQAVRTWVKRVEIYHPVGELSKLPDDAPLNKIEEAFISDRSVLMGIGEGLYEAAHWDAWPAKIS